MPHSINVSWAPAGLDVTWGSLSDFEQFPVALLKVYTASFIYARCSLGPANKAGNSQELILFAPAHLQNLLYKLCTIPFKDTHIVNWTVISWWLETEFLRLMSFQTLHPSDQPPLLQHDKQMWGDDGSTTLREKTNKQKMVLEVLGIYCPWSEETERPGRLQRINYFLWCKHIWKCVLSHSAVRGLCFLSLQWAEQQRAPQQRLQDDLTSAFPKFKMSWTSLVVPESGCTSHQPELVPSTTQLYESCGLETMSLNMTSFLTKHKL